MSRWRLAVVGVLVGGPFLVLAGLGWYYLWLRWGFYAWVPVTACMALGYGLAVHWQRGRRLLPPVEFPPPNYWTDRDREAWRRVEAKAEAASGLDPAKLGDLALYQSTTLEMAHDLAAFYHPDAQDPFGHLTVPETLAVAELVAHDLAELTDRYLPGGRQLSIDDWRRAQRWAQRVNRGVELYNTVSWWVSGLLNPVGTAARYAASRAGISVPLQYLQQNLLAWFYAQYVRRLGRYLIELNSGRLRVGATRYRQLTGTADPAADGDKEAAAAAVTVTVLGQVKAGKSSLINALLGERRAATDVVPATSGVERYELRAGGVPTRLVLLDTVGYGHAGPKADQLAVTREAARESDLLLLVLHARNPARQADLATLEHLRAYFASRPDLRKPPVVAVLTHIDLLSPALEWSPPYNWLRPTRPKEQNIHDAVAALRGQLGDHLDAVVPVCAAEGRVYGVAEELLPALAGRLDEAHGVGLLRCLMAEADAGKVRVIVRQLAAAGREVARAVWEGLWRLPAPAAPAPPLDRPAPGR
jgi:GTP-binding protein EngB required for normal cell division